MLPSDTRASRQTPVGGHAFTPPQPGHPDAPNACTQCSHGIGSPQHAATAAAGNAAVAREVAHLWLEGLTGLGGNTEAWGTAALRAVIAALDGETDLRKLYLSGLRMRVTPDGLLPYTPGDGDQEPLPLAS